MEQQLPNFGKKPTKIQSIFLVILFSFIYIPSMVQLIGVGKDNTFIDNRIPQKFPKFPAKFGDIPKFKKELSQFLQDNFGFRAELVKLNILINLKIGVSSVPGLILGKEGWLFLKNDYAILDQYRGINKFSNKELEMWVSTLNHYRDWLDKQKIYFVVVVAPNQQTVYSEYMPNYANKVNPETRTDQLAQYLKTSGSKINFIDLRGALISAKSKFPKFYLYNKYEGHWNQLGAFVAYEEIMRVLSSNFKELNQLQISDYEIKQIKKTWAIPPLSEDSLTLVLKNNQNNNKKTKPYKVLFYGDSFGDEGLLPMLKASNLKVLNIESNWKPLPVEIIDKEKPDIVIFELVERYLARPLQLESIPANR